MTGDSSPAADAKISLFFPYVDWHTQFNTKVLGTAVTLPNNSVHISHCPRVGNCHPKVSGWRLSYL